LHPDSGSQSNALGSYHPRKVWFAREARGLIAVRTKMNGSRDVLPFAIGR